MRKVWGLFAISGLILFSVLISRQYSPFYDGSRDKIDSMTARETERITSMPVCKPTVEFKATKPFNIQRAYPRKAMRRGIEGRVKALLRVDDQGRVLDVMVQEATPDNVFNEAVETVALKMEYELAEPACKGKMREKDLVVEFKLFD